MAKFLALFLLLALFSCSLKSGNRNAKKESIESDGKNGQLDTLQESPFDRSSMDLTINDSIIEIKIVPGAIIHWNNATSQIENDSLLNYIRSNFKLLQASIANEIRNTFQTHAKACSFDQKLAIGDLAYLVIDKIRSLPFFEITQFQLDVYREKCPYPEYFFYLIHTRRAYITTCVKNYLKGHL